MVAEAMVATTSRRRRPWGPVPLGILGVLLFLATWELASRSGLVSPNQVPPASEILATMVAQLGSGPFWGAVGHTMYQWLVGFALTILIAVPAGLALGSSELAWRALRPVVEFFRTVPGNVLIPLAVLLWGLSLRSAVFLIVFGCMWSLIIQTMYGARDVDPGARETAKAFRLSLGQRVRHVLLPSALPQIATGLRISSATALIIAISAEILIGVDGLGKDIALARTAGDVTTMYTLILASSFLGIAVFVVFATAERHFLRWHESQRREQPS